MRYIITDPFYIIPAGIWDTLCLDEYNIEHALNYITNDAKVWTTGRGAWSNEVHGKRESEVNEDFENILFTHFTSNSGWVCVMPYPNDSYSWIKYLTDRSMCAIIQTPGYDINVQAEEKPDGTVIRMSDNYGNKWSTIEF